MDLSIIVVILFLLVCMSFLLAMFVIEIIFIIINKIGCLKRDLDDCSEKEPFKDFYDDDGRDYYKRD